VGISRRTLYHWINTGRLERELDNGPLRYSARPAVARKIDRYREMIQVRLAEYPKLSATRLYEEICAAGYAGGYTQDIRDCCGCSSIHDRLWRC
jgi:transposase